MSLFLFAAGTRFFYPLKYSDEITAASQKHNVEAAVIYSIIKAESNFRTDAVSPAGAIGLMQVMPSTALFIAEKIELDGFTFGKLFEPETNIEIGTAYYRYLLNKFGDGETALAAYNAGEGAVGGWLKSPDNSDDGRIIKNIPYPETKEYVKRVEGNMKIYKYLYHL